jgi:6-phosphogluconolactonase (cycloisomerase 2 family)
VTEPSSAVLYASIGSTLFHYDLDVAKATLKRRGSVELPAGVQYAWRHPKARFLYVACSNGSPGVAGTVHSAVALRIETGGALQPHGDPVVLPSRPLHITTDPAGEHVLIAYNNPSAITAHRIRQNGTLSSAPEQQAALDLGVFAHQIRVAPSNATAILVTRGNDAAEGRPEDPGALKVFEYQFGQLRNKASIAPDGGIGFGPRHLDFHPTEPLIYVSDERRNRLLVFRMNGSTVTPAPAHVADTLAEPAKRARDQRAGAIHVHPAGRFVYVANRAAGKAEGGESFAGGENNIAVFALDAADKPSAVQHEDTRGYEPRTFAIDPSGRLLVVANAQSLYGVPANLAVFTLAGDGKLSFVAKHDVDTAAGNLFWMGIVAAR